MRKAEKNGGNQRGKEEEGSERGGRGVLGVNHSEIFLLHTRLQLKPNVRSRTSVVFGRGSLPTAPLLSSSADLSDKHSTLPPTKNKKKKFYPSLCIY